MPTALMCGFATSAVPTSCDGPVTIREHARRQAAIDDRLRDRAGHELADAGVRGMSADDYGAARRERRRRVAAGHRERQRKVAGAEDRDGTDRDLAQPQVGPPRRALRLCRVDAQREPAACVARRRRTAAAGRSFALVRLPGAVAAGPSRPSRERSARRRWRRCCRRWSRGSALARSTFVSRNASNARAASSHAWSMAARLAAWNGGSSMAPVAASSAR